MTPGRRPTTGGGRTRRPPRPPKSGPGRPRPTDARTLAWELLQRVEEGAFADALIGRALRDHRLDPRERSLLTALVYGTVSWQGFLDHLAEALSARPVDDLDAPVRSALRLGLFQITRLDRIPPFAAVDTAVNLVKRYKRGAAAGLVNAVLRRAAGEWRNVPLPDAETDLAGNLATRHSHPRWLVERWLDELGVEETQALLAANNLPAPTVLRVNRLRGDREAFLAHLNAGGRSTPGAAAAPTRFSPVGIELAAAGAPERVLGHAEGLCSVQGEASQLVGFLLAPRPGERVLDACAAPGGKATHLAELMDDRGEVVALDTRRRGVDRIRQMALRLGISIVGARVEDSAAWDGGPADRHFDRVLVDAPCSGLGTLRAHPELKWRRGANDVLRLAELQRSLLANLARRVRPGGTLVYATCTLTAEENEHQVAAFLAAHPEFSVADPRPDLPETIKPLIGADAMLRTWPHRHGLDGFFAVRLKRHPGVDIVGS